TDEDEKYCGTRGFLQRFCAPPNGRETGRGIACDRNGLHTQPFRSQRKGNKARKPMNFVRSLMLGMICTSVVAADTSGAQPAAGDAVIVNTQPLAAEEKQALEQRFAMRTYPGRYWYDAVSGAWGFERGPTAGFLPPGLRLGGPLRADAS